MKVKLLDTLAVVPTRANNGDAGYDLYSIETKVIPAYERATFKTGIAMSIPVDLVGLIWPRSGLSVKKGIDVLAGVVDSSYRGEIMVCLLNTSNTDVEIDTGDKIAQMIIQKYYSFDIDIVQDLDSTDRGEKGFGSSDEIPF